MLARPRVVVPPSNLLFAAALGLVEANAGPSPRSADAGAEAPRTTLSGILLRTEGVDETALRADLALRIPEIPITPHAQAEVPPPNSGAPVVFVDVRRGTQENRYDLTLVVSDGRAYDRVVKVDAGATVAENRRTLARNVANLVAAIEAGTVAPDRADVPIPPPEPPPSTEPVACPEPPACPEPRPPPAEVPAPRFEVGPRISLGALIGLGPPTDTDRFAGWGGSLGLGFRLHNGVVLVAAFRALGRRHALGDSLLRMRVSVGAGYAWRPHNDPAAHFELEALGMLHAEPWMVLREGSRAPLVNEPPSAAFGGSLRVAPGYRFRSASGRVSGRVGLWAELGASFVADAGAAVAKVTVQTRQGSRPMFRVGGPEVAGGLETVLWFGVGRAARRVSSRPRARRTP